MQALVHQKFYAFAKTIDPIDMQTLLNVISYCCSDDDPSLKICMRMFGGSDGQGVQRLIDEGIVWVDEESDKLVIYCHSFVDDRVW